jgi:DNA polymerase III subunit delta
MQIRPEQLASQLKRGLVPLYVVHGDEALLSIEACDQIRAAARAAGYTERDVLRVERGFRWNALAEAGQAMSLFGDRKIIELRIPTGKPGRDGAQALIEHSARASADVMTIIVLPRLDRDQRQSAWFGALERHGACVEVAAVLREALPDWIGQRLARQGQSSSREALAFIAERVEGNLLAAYQEIQKLALLFAPGEIAAQDIESAVLNVARYDVFKLGEAMLSGDAGRMTRMLDGLRDEGESPVLVQWAMADEIRALYRVKLGSEAGRPIDALLREARVWGARQRLLPRAVARLDRRVLRDALGRAAQLDRMAKGWRIGDSSGDIWIELNRLGMMVAAT